PVKGFKGSRPIPGAIRRRPFPVGLLGDLPTDPLTHGPTRSADNDDRHADHRPSPSSSQNLSNSRHHAPPALSERVRRAMAPRSGARRPQFYGPAVIMIASGREIRIICET